MVFGELLIGGPPADRGCVVAAATTGAWVPRRLAGTLDLDFVSSGARLRSRQWITDRRCGIVRNDVGEPASRSGELHEGC